MKKVYKIEVDCANCANLMELAVGKLDGVESVSVNFMAQKMTVKFSESADTVSVLKKIIKVCKKVEPDFEIEL